MMLLSDVPDKLAVTSFVYQMYNYFTKDVHSAITKPSQVNEPTSAAFDLSKFEEFSFNVTMNSESETPSSRSLTSNQYSRHSLKDSETSPQPTPQQPNDQPTPLSNQATPPSNKTSEDVLPVVQKLENYQSSDQIITPMDNQTHCNQTAPHDESCDLSLSPSNQVNNQHDQSETQPPLSPSNQITCNVPPAHSTPISDKHETDPSLINNQVTFDRTNNNKEKGLSSSNRSLTDLKKFNESPSNVNY